MHDDGLFTCRTSILALCLAILLRLEGAYCIPEARNESETKAKTETETGFTFNSPEKSYVEYRHAWEHDQGFSWTVGLRFRTTKSSAFLFHHFYLESLPSRAKPQVSARIKKGSLHVSYTDGGATQTIVFGKGLGRDQWHRVFVGLDLHKMLLTVDLDPDAQAEQRSLSLKGRNVTAGVSQILTSVISVGGYSPAVVSQRGHFVGCIDGVELLDGESSLDLLLFSTGQVEKGCHNQCQSLDPCKNGGRCVNHYVGVRCDCYGTDSDGKHCENSRVAITLQGSEWLIYDLYDDEVDGSRVQWSRLAIEFKTSSSEGILFYARELYPLYSHLAVSIHNSSLHISVIFVDQVSFSELFVSMGSKLDDNQWHRLTVVHKGQVVDATLDWIVERMTADRPNPHLRMPPSIYFGGMDVSASVLGLRSQRNFVGCLRGLFFNRESILNKLNTSRVRYHNDGSAPYQGCHDLVSSSLQFTHDGAFAKVEHPPSDALKIQLQFRTLKSNCFLTYTESSAASPKGYLQLSVVDGQLSIAIMSPDVIETVAIGNNLGDNKWHSLRVSYGNGELHMDVDEAFKVQTVRKINLGDATYLGFGPNTEMASAYIGCMRNLKIQDDDLDPVKVIHSQLGVGVTLGDCDLVDWCTANETSTLCLNGGSCVNSWAAPVCDCGPSGHYEGSSCQSYVDHSTVTLKDPSSFIAFHATMHPAFILGNFSISFRTVHRTQMRLLKIGNAEMNASLLMEIRQQDSLVISFIGGNRNTHARIIIPGLTSGSWQNLTVLQQQGHVQKVFVNGDSNGDIISYTENVDKSAAEDGVALSNGTDWEIQVGGTPKIVPRGHVIGFVGCVSDFRIGDFQFELTKMSQGLRGVDSGCTDRCLLDGCNNGGICLSGFDDTTRTLKDLDCDCSLTGWAGPRCDEDLQAAFDGASIIVDNLRNVEKLDEVKKKEGHDLEIHLTYSSLSAHFDLPSALAAVQSKQVDNFLLLYLTPNGSVSVMLNVKGNKVILNDDGYGTDGNPHRVSVVLRKQQITLQIDSSIHVVNLTTKSYLFVPNIFEIGGVVSNSVHFKFMKNFTGIVSNAFLRSAYLALSNSRPIDVFYGFHGDNDNVTVYGKVRPVHSPFVLPEGSPSGRKTTTDTIWRPYKDLLRNGPGESKRRVEGVSGSPASVEEETGRESKGFVGLAVVVALLSAIASVLIAIAVRRVRKRRQVEATPCDGQEPSDEEEGLLNEPIGYVECTSVSDLSRCSSAAASIGCPHGGSARGRVRGSTKYCPTTAFRRLSGLEIDDEDLSMMNDVAPPVGASSSTMESIRRSSGGGKEVVEKEVFDSIKNTTSCSNRGIQLYMSLAGKKCKARFQLPASVTAEHTLVPSENEEEMEWDHQSDIGTSTSSPSIVSPVGESPFCHPTERIEIKAASGKI